MEELFAFQTDLIAQVSNYQRSLINDISWQNRLIGIKGARGTGKTTLLLQHIKFNLQPDKEVQPLYITLDDLYFLENSLVEMTREFVLNGGTHLFVDEVHKYPNWSRELKLVYDRFP